MGDETPDQRRRMEAETHGPGWIGPDDPNAIDPTTRALQLARKALLGLVITDSEKCNQIGNALAAICGVLGETSSAGGVVQTFEVEEAGPSC